MCNKSDDEINGVDTTSSLNSGSSAESIPMPPLGGSGPGFLDVDEITNSVETTLSLNSRSSGESIPTTPLARSSPGFLGVDDGNQVDITSSLDLPGTAVTKRNDDDDQVFDDLSPIRMFRPYFNDVGSSTDHDRNQNQNLVDQVGVVADKIKNRRPGSIQFQGGDPLRRNIAGDDENQRPLIPIEGIPPVLFQTLKSRGGSGAVFLYRKKLEESDVQKYKNRLFVTRGERVMEFLTEEEAAAVNGGGEGIKILGIDGGGKVYEKMGVKKWASLRLIVIKSDWNKVVAENHAEKGDVVEIWGYRENEKPCLAFNFRREREGGGEVEIGGGGGGGAASTSSSGSND